MPFPKKEARKEQRAEQGGGSKKGSLSPTTCSIRTVYTQGSGNGLHPPEKKPPPKKIYARSFFINLSAPPRKNPFKSFLSRYSAQTAAAPKLARCRKGKKVSPLIFFQIRRPGNMRTGSGVRRSSNQEEEEKFPSLVPRCHRAPPR